MRLVNIESPYSGDVEKNVEYARRCMKDCLDRGEAPLASHLLYTQPGILDDQIADERKMGIEAGLAWAQHAFSTVVYCDLGITPGMQLGIDDATASERIIQYRWLDQTAENLEARVHKALDSAFELGHFNIGKYLFEVDAQSIALDMWVNCDLVDDCTSPEQIAPHVVTWLNRLEKKK